MGFRQAEEGAGCQQVEAEEHYPRAGVVEEVVGFHPVVEVGCRSAGASVVNHPVGGMYCPPEEACSDTDLGFADTAAGIDSQIAFDTAPHIAVGMNPAEACYQVPLVDDCRLHSEAFPLLGTDVRLDRP